MNSGADTATHTITREDAETETPRLLEADKRRLSVRPRGSVRAGHDNVAEKYAVEKKKGLDVLAYDLVCRVAHYANRRPS